jgi:O-antigen/teichoic acid export membrane protein
MHIWTHANAVLGLVTGLLSSMLALTTHSIVYYSLGPLIGQLVAVAYLQYRLPAAARKPRVFPKASILELLRNMFPFAAAFLALTLYSKSDLLLLNSWSSATQVGLYTAAYKFVDIAQALTTVVAAAVYPRLARRVATMQNKPAAEARVVEVVLLAATAGAGALWLLREQAVSLMFGSHFQDSAAVLAILAASLPLLAFSIVALFLLSLTGRLIEGAVAYGMATAVSIVLNLILIGRFGAVGVAVAKLASEIVLSILLGYCLHVAAKALPRRRALLVLAGMVTACVALALVPDPSGGWMRALAFAAFVSVLMIVGGGIERQELATIRHIATSRNRLLKGPTAIAS